MIRTILSLNVCADFQAFRPRVPWIVCWIWERSAISACGVLKGAVQSPKNAGLLCVGLRFVEIIFKPWEQGCYGAGILRRRTVQILRWSQSSMREWPVVIGPAKTRSEGASRVRTHVVKTMTG